MKKNKLKPSPEIVKKHKEKVKEMNSWQMFLELVEGKLKRFNGEIKTLKSEIEKAKSGYEKSKRAEKTVRQRVSKNKPKTKTQREMKASFLFSAVQDLRQAKEKLAMAEARLKKKVEQQTKAEKTKKLLEKYLSSTYKEKYNLERSYEGLVE